MTFSQKDLLAVLPVWLRKEVELHGSETLQELRLRINSPPELIFIRGNCWLKRKITQDDLQYIINTASRYSPWTAATIAQGFITVKGGHRIGLCGEAVVYRGVVKGINNISSMCIRIAKDYFGIAEELAELTGSILILGPPGWGKTTLLRDLIRQRGQSEHVCVVDERGELFPEGMNRGKRVDVLSGSTKRDGISMLMRTMGPECIAVDEITDSEDVHILQQAANCGVHLLATAHALSLSDFHQRIVYRPLRENCMFDSLVFLKKDKSFTVERMTLWK